MLFVSLGLTGMSTISSRPIPNGIDLSKTIGGGVKCWFCPCKHDGSQALLCKIAVVVRLHITSEMTHHSYGHSFPPKVSQRFMKANSKLGIWVTVFVAVSQFKWHRQYAGLKLSFFANILQPGYFNLAKTVQLINLMRHFPNLHGCSWVSSTREFTRIPKQSYFQLWLCVNQSFAMILPSLLIVHCAWILMGPCIRLEFESSYAMATGSQIRKWCHPRLTLESTLVAPLWFPNFIAF